MSTTAAGTNPLHMPSLDDLEARKLSLEIQKMERDLHNYDAHPDQNTTLMFWSPVTGSSVAEAIYDLDLMSRRWPSRDIAIHLNTPGGSIIEGYALIDFIRELQRRGHKVTIKVFGSAASMGAILLQAADDRVMSPLSTLCIHEPGAGFEGQLSKMKGEVKFLERLGDKALDILTSRSSTTKRTIRTKCKDGKDWWLDADEAVKHGFADRIE